MVFLFTAPRHINPGIQHTQHGCVFNSSAADVQVSPILHSCCLIICSMKPLIWLAHYVTASEEVWLEMIQENVSHKALQFIRLLLVNSSDINYKKDSSIPIIIPPVGLLMHICFYLLTQLL